MKENILHTQYWQNYRKPDFQIKSKCLFSAYSNMKQISKAYLEPNRTSNIDFCKKSSFSLWCSSSEYASDIPGKIYLWKARIRTPVKGVKYVQN